MDQPATSGVVAPALVAGRRSKQLLDGGLALGASLRELPEMQLQMLQIRRGHKDVASIDDQMWARVFLFERFAAVHTTQRPGAGKTPAPGQ